MNLLTLFISSIFVNNIILSRFLGCCPFLGVSTKSETAKGMGVTVIFVLVLAAIMTWLAYHLVLVPLHIEYLYTLSFILIIAALVQFVELALKKINPALYKSLGIFMAVFRKYQDWKAARKGIESREHSTGCKSCAMSDMCGALGREEK